MPNWSGGILTTRGLALQAKVDAGQTNLTFTKMKIGSGVLGSGQSLEALTDLITPKQNIGISGISVNGNITTLTGVITNAGLATGYQVRELGVYAQDPTLGEILYSITIDSAPDYLPPEGGAVAVSQEFNYHIAVSNAENVSATLSTSGLVTVGMLQSHNHTGTGNNGPKLNNNSLAVGTAVANLGFTPLNKAGDTLTGTLVTEAPFLLKQSNQKSWLITRAAGVDELLFVPSGSINGNDWDWTKQFRLYADGRLSLKGALMLPADPTDVLHAATKQYTDTKLPAANPLLTASVYKNRDVAAFSTGAQIMGTIKIMLPVGWTNTNIRLHIEGYDHLPATGAWFADIAGYNFVTTPAWLINKATLSPNCPFSSVRLAYDPVAGKCCILLGTTATVWTAPKIVVSAILGNGSVTSFASGWSITLITDESALTYVTSANMKVIATTDATAPGGYGLGTPCVDVIDDWNNAVVTGFYKGSATVANSPFTGANIYFFVDVRQHGTGFVVQVARCYGAGAADTAEYHRLQNGGVWLPWKRIPYTDSPTFTGVPTAPTAAAGTNTTQLASTAFANYAANGVLTKSVAGGSNVTLTAAEAGAASIIFTGALTANISVIVPATPGQWNVSNVTTGNYTLTVKTASGAGVAISQGANWIIFCDGTHVFNAITDFKNIALTGVPTAPTAAAGTKTTQLATAAFVDTAVNAAGLPVGFNFQILANTPPPGCLRIDQGSLVTRAAYPDLWAWVQANAPLITEAAWQAQAAAQSSVGAYSSGDGSTTFRLPRIVDYVRGSTTGRDPGTWQSDDLESHVHNLTGATGTGGNLVVFAASSTAGNTVTSMNNQTSATGGTETRPKSISMLHCVKAFGASANQGIIDITELANSIAAKMDASVKHIVSSWRSGKNWYRVWSDGEIEQGGYFTTSPVTFPYPFTDASTITVEVDYQNTANSGSAPNSPYPYSITTTGFSVVDTYASGTIFTARGK